jgi:hypothetical protein
MTHSGPIPLRLPPGRRGQPFNKLTRWRVQNRGL